MDSAKRNIIVGGLFFFIGLAVTIGTYSSASRSGGSYMLAWGPIIFGGIQFFKGLAQLGARR